MIKRLFIILSLVLMGFFFFKVIADYKPLSSMRELSTHYVTNGPDELGAANLVTAVVVTYRGFDTLGEIVVLFISAAGVAFLLRTRKEDGEIAERKEAKKGASELVQTSAGFLVPLIFIFGVYISINGHLTPGGGFQGGAVIASGSMLLFLAHPYKSLNHKLLSLLESFAGFSYVLIGLLGLLFAGGFLDNRFLHLGTFGTLMSAGAIPLIYILIGLKVGTELSVVLEDLRD